MHGPQRSVQQVNVRLLKVTLPTFDGLELSKWTEFMDIFKAAVNEKETLTDVERFTFQTGLVRRAAAEALEGISLAAVNYAEADEVLNR